MNDLARQIAASTAVDLRNALRNGEVSARDLVAATLSSIADRAELGAFTSITAEHALRDAAAADERLAAAGTDDHLPHLHGMPVAHKDLVDVAGATTTLGSAAIPHRVAAADDPGVATLRRAGTISLGKTQVPELGLNAYSENLIAAPARNPLDPSRTPGGSSGGTAAAVAAGLLPFAPGSDGGGSIRIPALACGLVGLKPGLGTIPSDVTHGTQDTFGAPRLTVTGPIARNAADAALLFDAMRGEVPAKAARDRALAAVHRADQLRGLRVGVSTVSPFEAAHPVPLSTESTSALAEAARRLEQLCHRIEETRFRYDPHYPEAFYRTWTAGLALLEITPDAEAQLTPLTREFREHALTRPERVQHEAAARMRQFASDARAQWGHYDVVLTPGLAFAPPRIGAFMSLSPADDYRMQCEWTPYTSMVNVSGLPAIAVPITMLPDGLSAGVQLIGRDGSEAQLLQLAAQLMA